eukprot:747705-Hanusia_phi.AAC.4
MSIVKGLQVAFLAPFLIYTVPPEHHQWINPILDLTCKFLAMTLAWYLTRVVLSSLSSNPILAIPVAPPSSLLRYSSRHLRSSLPSTLPSSAAWQRLGLASSCSTTGD